MNPRARLLIVLAIAALTFPVASARALDPEWAQRSRNVTISHGTGNFQFDSVREGGDDLLRGTFSLSSGELRLSYSSFDRGNASALLWTMAPRALVEFRDRDQNQRLDVGETVIRRVALKDLVGASVLVQPDGLDGHTITIRYPFNATRPDILPVIDPTQRGELEIRLGVLARAQTLEGVLVAPTTLPLRLDIERYPFNASDTLLAFEAELGSSRDLVTGASGLRSSDGTFESFVSWSPNGRLSGISREAHVTLLEAPTGSDESGPRRAYIAYGQASKIEHDLLLGVGRYAPEGLGEALADLVPGDWRFYAVGFAAAGALTGVSAWRRLKA